MSATRLISLCLFCSGTYTIYSVYLWPQPSLSNVVLHAYTLCSSWTGCHKRCIRYTWKTRSAHKALTPHAYLKQHFQEECSSRRYMCMLSLIPRSSWKAERGSGVLRNISGDMGQACCIKNVIIAFDIQVKGPLSFLCYSRHTCHRSCIWHFNTWQFHVYLLKLTYLIDSSWHFVVGKIPEIYDLSWQHAACT